MMIGSSGVALTLHAADPPRGQRARPAKNPGIDLRVVIIRTRRVCPGSPAAVKAVSAGSPPRADLSRREARTEWYRPIPRFPPREVPPPTGPRDRPTPAAGEDR